MAQSLHTSVAVKSVAVKIVGVSLAMLLVACSSPESDRQASGNEDYLEAPSLRQLQAPQGMILPVANGDYDVPRTAALNGAVGKAVNILPPAQSLPKEDSAAAQPTSQAAATSGNMDVQSSTDNTGLPLLVIRAPFTTVWNNLPSALNRIGMEVKDSNRTQGLYTVKYKEPGDNVWNSLAVKNPDLNEGEYKLQLGDLDNRSSLQVISSKGQALDQSQNDALVAVFQAALNGAAK